MNLIALQIETLDDFDKNLTKLKELINFCPKDSLILCEQVRTLDRARLLSYVSHLSREKMNEVNRAMSISIGLTDNVPHVKSA